MRKPYFKKREKCWYVTGNARKEIRLDPDEATAYQMWREMVDAATQVGPNATYRRLAEEFLQGHFEDKPRFKQDARHIALFAKHIGLKRAVDVTKKDVVEWLNADKPGQRRKEGDKWVEGSPKNWSQRTKKDAYAAISRVFRWAMQEGMIQRNPIASLKIAGARPRTATISEKQFTQLMEACDPAFRLYLIACAKTGARPRQIREVEAENVLPDFSAWIFYEHKTDATGKPLVVYLSPCMQTLTRILTSVRRNGPLFRNSQGNPWKKDTVVHKMARLRKKLGLSANVINYAFRHTYATNSLLKGNSLQETAELLGHKDARMVSQVYGHLDQHREHLAAAARRVQGLAQKP